MAHTQPAASPPGTQGAAQPAPRVSSVGQPQELNLSPDMDFEVELPTTFERTSPRRVEEEKGPPENPIAEASRGQELPPVIVQKTGASALAVFSLALLANLLVVGAIIAFGYFLPKEANQALELASSHLKTHGKGDTMASFTPSSVDPGARIEVLDLEDRAINRGDRTAYAELVRQSQMLERLDPLFDAVHASLIRIRTIYQTDSLPLPAPLQAGVILPGASHEPDLTPVSLIQAMRDRRHESETRRRAAFLLSSVHSPPAQKALYNTIQDDPNLNVVAQAFQSFQKSTGYPGIDPFDTDALESWWFQNASTFLGQN